MQEQKVVIVRVRHGHCRGNSRRTKVYRAWMNMKGRCSNPKRPDYERYGKRGITYCERWENFDNFLEDMGEPPTPKHQLERKDNSLGYSKENCIWDTPKRQANNRRSSRLIEHNGRTQTLQAWCDELGLKHSTVSMRINKYGWPPEKALSTPARDWSPGKTKQK